MVLDGLKNSTSTSLSSMLNQILISNMTQVSTDRDVLYEGSHNGSMKKSGSFGCPWLPVASRVFNNYSTRPCWISNYNQTDKAHSAKLVIIV